MGSFITNLHVRGVERDAAVAALRELRVLPAYVSGEPGNPWFSIYPNGIDQNGDALQNLGAKLSRKLQQPLIAFIVHDSDIFMYWLYDNGAEQDRYDSAPGYFDGVDSKPAGADCEVLKRYCVPGTTVEQLTGLLHAKEPAPNQGRTAAAERSTAMKTQILDGLRRSYPMMKKQRPDLPNLEDMLAEAVKRFASLPSMPDLAQSGKSFVFAEHMTQALAKHLGLSEGRAIDSYRYLENGEGAPGTLLLVDEDGAREIKIEK
jgi:hypothetical protein